MSQSEYLVMLIGHNNGNNAGHAGPAGPIGSVGFPSSWSINIGYQFGYHSSCIQRHKINEQNLLDLKL